MFSEPPGPLTPQALLAMATAYQQCRPLLTAVELGLFAHLAAGPRTAEDLADACGADVRALTLLLDALAALGLLSKQGRLYANSEAAQELLVPGQPNSILAALQHFVNGWNRWQNLTTVIRTGRPVEYREVNDRGCDELEAFIGAMDVLARDTAPQIAQAVGLAGVRRMLDVGGGSGSYAIAFARAEPGLSAVVFDLPNVVPIAERAIRAAGLTDRITTRSGDYHTNDLGTGFDLVLLSAIVHSNSPEENAALLARCGAALVPGGRIVIRDFVMSPDRTHPPAGAIFALNMLVGTQGGSTYTEAEMRAWLEGAGCSDVRLIPLPGMNTLLVGTKT